MGQGPASTPRVLENDPHVGFARYFHCLAFLCRDKQNLPPPMTESFSNNQRRAGAPHMVVFTTVVSPKALLRNSCQGCAQSSSSQLTSETRPRSNADSHKPRHPLFFECATRVLPRTCACKIHYPCASKDACRQNNQYVFHLCALCHTKRNNAHIAAASKSPAP